MSSLGAEALHAVQSILDEEQAREALLQRAAQHPAVHYILQQERAGAYATLTLQELLVFVQQSNDGRLYEDPLPLQPLVQVGDGPFYKIAGGL